MFFVNLEDTFGTSPKKYKLIGNPPVWLVLFYKNTERAHFIRTLRFYNNYSLVGQGARIK